MTLGRSLLISTTGFALASLAVFGLWAALGRFMYRSLGEAGFYAVCAVMFVLLGAILLKPLTSVSFKRFLVIYAAAFLAYALCWCLAWFVVRGRASEWVGSLAGSLAFCIVLAALFQNWPSLLLSTLVLFVAHSAGYFSGGYAHAFLKPDSSVFAKLGWGLCYGLGTGAGIGFAFYKVQRRPADASPPQTS